MSRDDDDAERSDAVGAPPACGGERRHYRAATMQSAAMREEPRR
jgi:hypothetical protein